MSEVQDAREEVINNITFGDVYACDLKGIEECVEKRGGRDEEKE